jgi:hypothetical protein
MLIERLINQLDQLRADVKATTERTGPLFDTIQETLLRARTDLGESSGNTTWRDDLGAAAQTFHDLKCELLGGEFRIWIKEIANPTDEEMQVTLRRTWKRPKGPCSPWGEGRPP